MSAANVVSIDVMRERRAQQMRKLTIRQLAEQLDLARLYADDGAHATADVIVEVVANELRRRAK
jgi:hypothetical protein